MSQLRIISTLIFCSVFASPILAQSTRPAADYSQLTAAITASVDGDVINVTNNIVVTAEITSNKTITFNGNNYSISVPRYNANSFLSGQGFALFRTGILK